MALSRRCGPRLTVAARRPRSRRKDATLKELSDLIKGVRRQAQQRTARLSFAFVFPDKNGVNTLRTAGQVFMGRRSEDDRKTLTDLRFETGDFLDVAIHV